MEAAAQIKKNVRSIVNFQMNGNDSGDRAFEEAFSICNSIFHNQINQFKTIGFNHSKFRSIKATVHSALKIYDISVFRALNEDMIQNHTDLYGTFIFSPNTFLKWLKDSKKKLEESSQQENENLIANEHIEDKALQSAAVHSLIPEVFNDKRVLPNVFLRSALFGIVRTGRRQFVRDEIITSMSQYEVYYTGDQLDQNDLAVLDNLIFLAKHKNNEEELRISMYELCKFMDYSQSKTNSDAIKARINRLQICQVKIRCDKKLYAGSFLDDYFIDEVDRKLAIRLNKKLLSMFSSNDYTLFSKKIQSGLGENQLARWLFQFYETHHTPLPFKLDYLKKLSRSDSEQKSFNRTLKTALALLKNTYEKNERDFDYKIEDSKLNVTFKPHGYCPPY